MIRSTRICGLAILLALLTAPQAWAQTDDSPADEPRAVEEDNDEGEPQAVDEPAFDDESEAQEEASEDVDEADDAADQPDEPADEPDDEADQDLPDDPADEAGDPADQPDEPADEPHDEGDQDFPDEPNDEGDQDLPDDPDDIDEEDWPDEWNDDWDDEEFDDFADDIDFRPLDELDDALLDRITPISTFPYIDHGGQLRIRPQLRHNFDLGTGGTSAVLPPVETVFPEDQPVDPDTSLLTSADLRLRFSPVVHLTENLRVHTNVDLLDNIALGADPRHDFFVPGAPSPDRRVMDSSAGQPGPIHVREAYGELDTFFGTFMAGRMLNHWGLGIFANDGECADCDFGDQVDRAAFRTRLGLLGDIYVKAAYDMPDAGISPRRPGFDYSRQTQLGRFDTASQWTFAVHRSTLTREERQQEAHQLADGLPVYNGGLYFSMRSQDGDYIQPGTEFDPDADELDFVYRGLQTYHFSPWFQFQISPEPDQHIRVELEGLTTFGSVDNATNQPVGFTETGESSNVNCFDDDERDGTCSIGPDGESTDASIRQFGLALETEFDLGIRPDFGLNTGFATGGDEPNWGYGAPPADQVDFTRFSPDYHVDLILFREVIGTVTNAIYVNPYLSAKFLDSGLQHIEARLDAIASRAFDAEGTPGQSPFLGLELDASLAYVDGDSFTAAVDGGVLLPMGGLNARQGREALNAYDPPEDGFTSDASAGLAWTVQGRLMWNF